ncbi:pimeloyl-ACP methyl ester carboxylesterase [Nocardiopsis mwathae]|uniref:Pimeloyl-ACP methyl ester carboxylesterase n=1 Tax=Nocardiopsis mwathae TaxID=1472723 RepID=A0A7W9YGJ2_9ACTN|nr:alpha/beta fold hydrolase [Nocardiopsis mwathae]MBB6171689.1 pimeloyl-ACP methyl ester carboxylesterase [Nocardiopsis mwathae]
MDHVLPERFESAHGTVRWARHGQGSPVVLLHGTPFSSYVWRDIAAALGTRHTVYLWDMPGYGASAKYAGQRVSLAAQQSVFTALLRHWDLDRPAVIAHDFGGAVALRSALLDGVGYDRLALLDAVSLCPWGSDFFRLVHRNAEVFAALPAHLHEALVRGYIATASHRGLRGDVLDALAAPWLGEEGQPAFYRQIAQADERHTADVEERYAKLSCPVLVAWGREDTWLSPDHAERLAQCIPHARLRWIDAAGHLVQEDAPAQVTVLLTEFLDAR